MTSQYADYPSYLPLVSLLRRHNNYYDNNEKVLAHFDDVGALRNACRSTPSAPSITLPFRVWTRLRLAGARASMACRSSQFPLREA